MFLGEVSHVLNVDEEFIFLNHLPKVCPFCVLIMPQLKKKVYGPNWLTGCQFLTSDLAGCWVERGARGFQAETSVTM